MKANETPKKIYLQDSMSTDTIGDLWPEWFDAKVSDNSIEYTRTDAFIENACEWLKNNVEKFYYLDEAYDKVISIKNLNNAFKKYMKGE